MARGINSDGETSLTKFEDFIGKVRSRPLARTERFECTFAFPNSFQGEIARLREVLKGRNSSMIASADKQGGVVWGGLAENECTIMCEEVQIPGMVLQNKEVPIGAWNFMRNSNVNFLGNEINITFLTDIDWYLRHVFEAWISHCVNTTSKEVAFPDDQYGEVSISALDWGPGENVRTTWKLYEVTPKVLNLIPLAMMGTSIARTTLIISSAYWTSKVVEVAMAADKNEQPTG